MLSKNSFTWLYSIQPSTFIPLLLQLQCIVWNVHRLSYCLVFGVYFACVLVGSCCGCHALCIYPSSLRANDSKISGNYIYLDMCVFVCVCMDVFVSQCVSVRVRHRYPQDKEHVRCVAHICLKAPERARKQRRRAKKKEKKVDSKNFTNPRNSVCWWWNRAHPLIAFLYIS